MGRIRKLDRQVAELIAAGEVVERPSSVVKELIENALDAGAGKIVVEIENGGISYIRVTDNGCGMSAEDAQLAFFRHATSKLWTAEDLYNIKTLGFRGEALAAIAAVSKIDLLTCAGGEAAGVHLRLEGGKQLSFEEAGCPEGTTIVIRDLFYNTPARLKFMKKDVTEGNYVAQAVFHAALSSPGVSFTLIKNGKRELYTQGDGRLRSAVYSLYGREYVDRLLPVSVSRDGMSLTGFLSKPEYSRINRAMQEFFVNGRYVRSSVMSAALEEAYKERIMAGRHPTCVLMLTVSPASLDVNIHPAKTEIKFQNDRRVFELVYFAAAAALDGDLSRPEGRIIAPRMGGAEEGKHQLSFDRPTEQRKGAEGPAGALPLRSAASAAAPQIPLAGGLEKHLSFSAVRPSWGGEEKELSSLPRNEKPMDRGEDRLSAPREIVSVSPEKKAEQGMKETLKQEAASALSETKTSPEEKLPEKSAVSSETEKTPSEPEPYRVLGELFSTYILVEQGDGLLLIDKHAAHERIRFNRLMKGEDAPPQLLLAPVSVRFTPEECALLLENRELLEETGFEVEDFGLGVLLVRQVPAYISEEEIAPVLGSLAEGVRVGRMSRPELKTRLLERIACVGAVKAKSYTDERERDAFAAQIMASPEIKYCPHGRPVVIRMSRYQIEKQFGRV